MSKNRSTRFQKIQNYHLKFQFEKSKIMSKTDNFHENAKKVDNCHRTLIYPPKVNVQWIKKMENYHENAKKSEKLS